jgi:DNA-binding NarL/FixJ family response regulator
MASRLNLKVLVLDTDFYALQSLNSYLAWDRRTRVVALAHTPAEAVGYLRQATVAELPDVILLESEAFPDPEALRSAIVQFRQIVKDVVVICLAHRPDARRASAAVDAGARAYLLRSEVRLQLVGAICFALDYPYVVTPGIQQAAGSPYDARVFQAALVPPQREYPEMSERIRQALWLCVVEGMPAQLAADEMGISPHTIRSYIKEGYRILEAHDDKNYPEEIGPLEKAWMRFTALEDDEDTENKKPPEG